MTYIALNKFQTALGGSQPPERLLVVDDETHMRTSLRLLLESPGREVLHCGTGCEAIGILKSQEITLVLLDVNLPDMTGLEVLEWIAGNRLKTTVIMMSAADNMDFAIQALRSGAVDFVRKTSEFDDIRRKVESALHQGRLERSHALMTSRLEHSLVFIDALLAHAPLCIAVFDGESGECMLANNACAEMPGYCTQQGQFSNFRVMESWKEHGLDLLAVSVLADGASRTIELVAVNRQGKTVELDYSLSRFEVTGKLYLMLMASDISGRKRLEEENRRIESQMLHVQKLECLGVLAGGIAHDFNNILTSILGNASLAMLHLPTASPASDKLHRIEDAAQRAADLARQMLAYSGKGRFIIQSHDVNEAVREITQILEVSISKKAQLAYRFGERLPNVDADITQLRQVIMNLVINASEAIEQNDGSIIITTGVRECTRLFLSEAWIDDLLPEGAYVFIEITDNGCGMDKETVTKIFDPFFSTKFTGRGLGMAAVLGIIRGHKGAIKVQTEKGTGTTFTLLFPASLQTPLSSAAGGETESSSKGCGTVLLVDDEPAILELGADMLRSLGYEVLTATDGFLALETHRQHPGEISCVILDLTMPHLDGEQTFRELRQLDPTLRIVVSSGYNEQEVTQLFAGVQSVAFLQKPYTMGELAKSLHRTTEVNREPVLLAV